jgi:chromosome segregation ATPase
VRRKRETEDQVIAEARERLRVMIDAELKGREAELLRTLSIQRAEAAAQLAEEHRKLTQERRDEISRAEQSILTELSTRLVAAQKEFEGKLASWTHDLERAREGLVTQLARLEERQRQLITEAERRFARETERLTSDADESRGSLARLRTDIEHQIKEANDAAESELETHAAERRRALHEVADRLRNRERTLAEQIERELAESVRKVSDSFGDVERRLVEQVERSVAREAARLTEEAAIEFNSAIRTTREEAARRLSRELDRAIESFSRQAERLLGDRLAEIGQSGGGQIERRLQNVISEMERRQEEFFSQLERRMAQAETTLRQRMDNLAGVAARHLDG